MSVTFDYWSDPLCIWAYVTQARHDAVLERFGEVVEVRTRLVPVFGSVVHRFREGAWSEAGVEGRVATTARVAAEHGPPGCEVDGSVWRTDCPASSWAPAMAVAGVGLLEEEGAAPQGSQGRYLRALRCRFFEDNVNMARRAEQLAVARRLDLDPEALAATLDDGRALAALYEDHEAREAQCVQGSPTYVFAGGRTMIYGNFDQDVLFATVQAYLEGEGAGGSRC